MTTTRRRRKAATEATTTDKLLEGLNPEQQEVVKHHTGAALVVAVAGAGKTRALVHRIAYLIAHYKVIASTILAVTFSKKAADEMNERLRDLGVNGARVGTWHSVAWEIVRAEWPEYAEWDLDSRDRFRIVVKAVLGYQGMKWNNADIGIVLQYIGRCKGNLAKAGTVEAEDIAVAMNKANPCNQTVPGLLFEAYERAEDAREQRQMITFDDMLVMAWEVLKDDDTRAKWSSRFDFVLQDEAQDENRAQITLGEQLARPHGNYMMVGDPAQSIYGFRGALPEKLLAFESEWNAKVIKMHRNYRSGASVIEAANGVIRAMDPTTHLGVEMTAERGTEAVIKVNEHIDMDAEGEDVAAQLQEFHASGTKWSDMVVLYRTNAQSRGVEEACLSNRIPYIVLGGTNFYERREVKDLVSYLRVAAGRGNFDNVKRCINAPFRFLGRAFVDKIEECAGSQTGDVNWIDAVNSATEKARIQQRQKISVTEWTGLINNMAASIEIQREARKESTIDSETREKHGPAALLERVIKNTDYMRYLTRDEGAETAENNRVSNVRELVRASERFATVDELIDYIDETLTAAKNAKNERGERVTLCSLHRSKGLEWPVVFIIGVNEKILPHGRAEDDGEERRLFYVGVTRARDYLVVSHVTAAAFGSKVVPLEPSRFLDEAGLLEGDRQIVIPTGGMN